MMPWTLLDTRLVSQCLEEIKSDTFSLHASFLGKGKQILEAAQVPENSLFGLHNHVMSYLTSVFCF